MHVTPVVRRKGICHAESRAGIDVFLVEDAWVVIAVELEKPVAGRLRGWYHFR